MAGHLFLVRGDLRNLACDAVLVPAGTGAGWRHGEIRRHWWGAWNGRLLPDLAGLIAALHDGEVRFVVIGAVAVGAHGHIRATQDLDIVPEPRHLNLDRLGNVLVTLDARLSADQRRGMDAELRHALYAGRNLTLTTRIGDLDIVQRLPGVPP